MWNKISLYKFQQIDKINSKKISDIDKTLFCACVVFNLTEYELDNASVRKAAKLITKIGKIFSSPFKPEPFKRIGKYFINYDISKMTFGQYIELSFFLSSPVENAHYITATISNTFLRKNKPEEHRKKSEYFLKQPITKIMGGVSLIIEKYKLFNDEYKTLFGLDKEVNGDVQTDFFNKRYGWIYSASQVAEYERITLDEAFRLPVRLAFNDLAYLKAKAKYETEQLNKK